MFGLMLPFAKFCENEISVYSSLISVINTCLSPILLFTSKFCIEWSYSICYTTSMQYVPMMTRAKHYWWRGMSYFSLEHILSNEIPQE